MNFLNKSQWNSILSKKQLEELGHLSTIYVVYKKKEEKEYGQMVKAYASEEEASAACLDSNYWYKQIQGE
jgi:hypothetical protein